MNDERDHDGQQPPTAPEDQEGTGTGGRSGLRILLIVLVGVPLALLAIGLLVLGACFLSLN